MKAFVDQLWGGAANGDSVWWAVGSPYKRGPLLFGTDAFGAVANAVAAGASEVWVAPGDYGCPDLFGSLSVVGCGEDKTRVGSGAAGYGVNLIGDGSQYWRFDRLSLVGVAVAAAVVLVSNGKAAFVRSSFRTRADADFGTPALEYGGPAVEARGRESAAVLVACVAGRGPVAVDTAAVATFRPPLADPGGSTSAAAGAMRPGYTLEAPARRRAGTGEKSAVWVPVADFSASMEPIGGGERTVGRIVVASGSYQLRTRGGLPATRSMRVRYRDRIWEITDVRGWSGYMNDTFLGVSEQLPEGEPRE